MVKQILIMPIFRYIAVLCFFALYIRYGWKKHTKEQNLIMLILGIALLFAIYDSNFFVDSKFIFSGCEADTVFIQGETNSISVPIDDLYQEQFGFTYQHTKWTDKIKRLTEPPFLTLYFYQNNAQVLYLAIYKTDTETEYSATISGTPVITTFNGNIIRFHKAFYDNLSAYVKLLH